VPGTAGPPQAPSRQGSSPGQQTPPGLHEVERGENLWEISRRHLASATGRDEAEVGTREVAVYWLRVVAANRARLRTGNPDLIYRGEFVRLPAIRRSS
jgi:nucleoid-associated protein YgaU